MAETSSLSTDVSFTLEIVAGCDSTTFVDWSLQTIDPLEVYVLGESMQVNLGPVEDSVSRQSGNNDGLTFCGDRNFKIIDQQLLPDFITFDKKANQLSL